ncbi:1-aminocyclopropane-1-carboxylate synthase [Olea europaea subsp. europaea]|uniref:1-aminocyclopropane-1-carboxylate synthase n=1 Tax=Olea europaea subsp. europaea TaxID=158383 RepID=A0A8S0VG37_OLEEU|nr:1-aminocyclopropane-1-carboxylate synthase [Olea europaea subsp. europaea]
MEFKSGNTQLLSKLATNDQHGENSPYFDGWKAYDNDPFHPTQNPNGVIQMGLAENQLSFDLIEEWVKKNPRASICTHEGVDAFKDIAIFQDYHGLQEFRNAVAKFMEKVRGGRVTFVPDRIVMAGGATRANELLMFCLADPGDAFLVPHLIIPRKFDRDLSWRTRVRLLPIYCESSSNFQITIQALEEAYENARKANIKVKGLIIANPSNPLGSTMAGTRREAW